jgi:ComF family protein
MLTGAVSAGAYKSEYLRRGVHWLKFKGVRPIAPILAGLLIDQLGLIAPMAQLQTEAALVPVPLHIRRQRQRGFNQAALIARALARQTAIPYFDLLTRSKFTWTQTKLRADMRQSNLAGAFALACKLPKNVKTVLIVDDVTTTGATLNEAALAIWEEYSDVKFWGVTVARG